MANIKPLNFKDNVSLVIGGEAGQGIQTIEFVLTKVLKNSGLNVFANKEYMSRVRGGSNSTEIRIGSKPLFSFVNRIDILIALDNDAYTHLKPRISENTLILADKETLKLTDEKIIDVPLMKLAKETGGAIFSNVIAVGFLCCILNIPQDEVKSFIQKYFESKGKEIVDKNLMAVDKGFMSGQEFLKKVPVKIEFQENSEIKNHLFISGAQAFGLGAIAGGCNFISSYPMTPSTGVFTFLAQQGEKFGIVVEQAEDEICAINMACGSWYAGGRAIVSTSGGGFALMVEGLSLVGCIESPMVINLAQRPSPATGLPTRTEQGDLMFALYGGHGEFPRVIYAPGSLEDMYFCAYKAFQIADKYQVPVIVLTDQFLADALANIPNLPKVSFEVPNQIIKTKQDYKRHEFTENGISPRGIPGYGTGCVCVDSDEHDEAGYITEDFDMRIKMVNKRLLKQKSLMNEILEPEFYGSTTYKTLLIGWGSNRSVVIEAMDLEKNQDIGFLHFKQVWPLKAEHIEKYANKAQTIKVIENNATGQFASLIRQQTSVKINESILKYNGLPFTVEEVQAHLRS